MRPTTRASPTGPMWSLAALKASRDLGLCLFWCFSQNSGLFDNGGKAQTEDRALGSNWGPRGYLTGVAWWDWNGGPSYTALWRAIGLHSAGDSALFPPFQCSDTGIGESLYLIANAFSFTFLAGKSTAPLLGGGRGVRREARRKSERADLSRLWAQSRC